MSMEVRPGYVNPLTTRSYNRLNSGLNQRPGGKDSSEEQVRDLKARQQQLENQLLLMKTTGTDGGGVSREQVEDMEEELERTNVDLRSARADSLGDKKMDYYEKTKESDETGIYDYAARHGRTFR